MDMETRTIELEDGATLHSRVRPGDGSGKSRVLFIHGTPGTGSQWRPFFQDERLAGRELIAVDRLGFGQSTRGHAHVTLTSQTASLAPLLTTRTIVVGHSHGASIALDLAARRPDELGAALLLAGQYNPASNWGTYPRRLYPLIGWALPRSLATCNRELLALPRGNRELAPLLERVTIPITVVHGAWDPLVPYPTIRHLETRLPNSRKLRVELLPRTGHLLQIFKRDLVVERILELEQVMNSKPNNATQ